MACVGRCEPFLFYFPPACSDFPPAPFRFPPCPHYGGVRFGRTIASGLRFAFLRAAADAACRLRLLKGASWVGTSQIQFFVNAMSRNGTSFLRTRPSQTAFGLLPLVPRAASPAKLGTIPAPALHYNENIPCAMTPMQLRPRQGET